MNSSAVRIRKEARALFWPWCIVAVTGALHPLLERNFFGQPGVSLTLNLLAGNLGFFIGIPLLATLSLSNEFEHKTISTLLSQPIDRTEIWRAKVAIGAVAVLLASLVYAVTWRATLQLNPRLALFAAGWILLNIASGVFWALVAKSTVGSLILNLSVQMLLLMGLGNLFVYLAPNLMPLISAAILCYGGFMLWLGRSKLVSFQWAADTNDLGLPEVLSGLTRPSRREPLLNLLRKEARLLQPVWLLTLLCIGCIACLIPIAYLLGGGAQRVVVISSESVILMLSVLAVVLAGTLSMAEERISGTHSWHLTLPVSVRRQWFVKLLMVLSVSTAVTALIIVAAGLVPEQPFRNFLDPGVILRPRVWWAYPLIGLCAFWCACAVKGTVKAALWVFPVAGMLTFTMGVGAAVFPNRLPVLRQLIGLLVSRFHPYPFTDSVIQSSRTEFGVLCLLVVLSVIAIAQSYRMFRIEVADGVLLLIRYLLPLAACAFVLGLFYRTFGDTVLIPYAQVQTVLRETHAAVEGLQPDATQPRQIAIEDLARTSQLSDLTRRWLNNSSVVVGPRNQNIMWVTGIKPDSKYKVTITLPHSWSCATYGKGTWGCRGPGSPTPPGFVVP